VVSKEVVGAIQRMGVPPNRGVVDKLAAKVIAYRSQIGSKEGDSLFQGKAMSKEVREKVGEYEARK
jgi:hypothetical protein